jgi:hypothetical protein
VNDAEISDEILSVFLDNHKLAFPELLVVGDLVVVGLTFSNLEDTLRAVDGDTKVLKLFSVNGFEGHVELVLWSLVGQRLKDSALEVALSGQLFWRQFLELAGCEFLVLVESLKSGVVRHVETGWIRGNQLLASKVTGIDLDLINQCVVAIGVASVDDLLHELNYFFRVGWHGD